MDRFLPGTPRGSSFNLNMGRANTPSLQATSPVCVVRDLDRVIHNPTNEQLAEMLKVVMMTQGCFEPVPVQYNSAILNLLEGYHKSRLELAMKTQELEEAKKEAAALAKELKEKSLVWEEEQTNYNTELKKMEVMLSGGQRGLELVSVARSNSLLRRGKKSAELKLGDNDQVNNRPGFGQAVFTQPGFGQPGFAKPSFGQVTNRPGRTIMRSQRKGGQARPVAASMEL